MTSRLDSLEVFFGELTPSRAVIRARLPGVDVGEGLSLAGLVRGPRCSLGNTLPATYRLVGRVFNPSTPESGQVENLSYVGAQALITEPVFWTPDWPALYDVTVELRRGSETIETATRTIGFRPLTVLDKGFDFAGKFWVLRGVRREHSLAAAIDECREHAAALMAPAELLDETLLKKASERGVLLVAELRRKSTINVELSRLGRHAAVALAVLSPGENRLERVPRNNVLLVQHADHPQKGHPLASEVRLVLAEVFNDWDFADWAQTLLRPVIAYRPLERPTDIGAARAACDQLQRDLAPGGQFAGYIV